MTYPINRLLNKAFVYVPAANTDLRKTFEAARERLKTQQAGEPETALQLVAKIREVKP